MLDIEKLNKKLNKLEINISNLYEDGRNNSIEDEKIIINILNKNKIFYKDVYVPNVRCWFDFSIDDYVFNIKSSTCSAHDNAGNIKLLLYLFHPEQYPIKNINSLSNIKSNSLLDEYIDNICSNKINLPQKVERDYYYLILNKTTSTLYVTSLMNIPSEAFKPNAKNKPFQIHWGLAKEKTNLSVQKQIEYIINVYIESCRKEASKMYKYSNLYAKV